MVEEDLENPTTGKKERNTLQKNTLTWRETCGTSQLCDEGWRSSYFFPVKMSMATKWHLAWPCLPGRSFFFFLRRKRSDRVRERGG